MWRLIVGEPHELPATGVMQLSFLVGAKGAHRTQFGNLHSGLAFVGSVPDLAAGRSCDPAVCSYRKLRDPAAVRLVCHAGFTGISHSSMACVMALS
jgi:hypothetical protein